MSQNGNFLAFKDIGFESDPEWNIGVSPREVPVFFCKKFKVLHIAICTDCYRFIVISYFDYDISIGQSTFHRYAHEHRGCVKPSGQPVIIKIHPAIVPGVIFVFFLIGRAINILSFHSDPVTVTYRRKRKPQWFRQDAARIRNGKNRCCFYRKAVLAIPCFQRP